VRLRRGVGGRGLLGARVRRAQALQRPWRLRTRPLLVCFWIRRRRLLAALLPLGLLGPRPLQPPNWRVRLRQRLERHRLRRARVRWRLRAARSLPQWHVLLRSGLCGSRMRRGALHVPARLFGTRQVCRRRLHLRGWVGGRCVRAARLPRKLPWQRPLHQRTVRSQPPPSRRAATSPPRPHRRRCAAACVVAGASAPQASRRPRASSLHAPPIAAARRAECVSAACASATPAPRDGIAAPTRAQTAATATVCATKGAASAPMASTAARAPRPTRSCRRALRGHHREASQPLVTATLTPRTPRPPPRAASPRAAACVVPLAAPRRHAQRAARATDASPRACSNACPSASRRPRRARGERGCQGRALCTLCTLRLVGIVWLRARQRGDGEVSQRAA
jgi:hypothetical protein